MRSSRFHLVYTWALTCVCLYLVKFSASLKCYSCLYLQDDETGLSTKSCQDDPSDSHLIEVPDISPAILSHKSKTKHFISSIFPTGANFAVPMSTADTFKDKMFRNKENDTGSSNNGTSASKTESSIYAHCFRFNGTVLGKEIVIRDFQWTNYFEEEDEQFGREDILLHGDLYICKTKHGCNDSNVVRLSILGYFISFVALVYGCTTTY